MTEPKSSPADDLRGASRLVIDAVAGITDIVESMHGTIARVKPPLGAVPAPRAPGLAGLVYRSVRGVTRAVGYGLDTALGALSPLLERTGSLPQREALLAALNGVLGDHLAATDNPLAIRMRFRQAGKGVALEPASLCDAHGGNGRLLILLHGLCMNDLQWQRQGHDHGAALARDLGFTPLYLHYNSGRAIPENGREFADLMQALVQSWPVPIERLAIVGHSMGGLIARSALHQSRGAGQTWPRRLDSLVCLGSPHFGAPLERAGNRVDYLLGISPYSAPFARLGRIRSAGIQDLRHGRVLDEGEARQPGARQSAAVPLPRGVRCYAVAASKQKPGRGKRLVGDGLVPVASALGEHADSAISLRFPAAHRSIVHEANHFDLLHREEVYARLRDWLADR
jgi:pimeloyl-ACP methyl ester carboxylesterase